MAIIMGGTNPYVSTYNGVSHSSQVAFQRISTGSKYQNVATGASEYAIISKLMSNLGATTQSSQNTQNMSSMVKVAQDATGNTISGLTTIQSHLINAANDTNGSLDRQAIQKEIDQLVSQIDSNAYVEYNGQRLLDGSRETLTFAGLDGYRNLQVGDIRSQTLGLTDADGNITIDATTPEGIQNSLATIGGALEYVEGMNGDLYPSLYEGYSLDAALDEATTQGAQLQRLEYQQQLYTTMEENQLGALSSMGDTDIAKQITNLRSEETLEQMALFGIKMFNQNRASAVTLLQ